MNMRIPGFTVLEMIVVLAVVLLLLALAIPTASYFQRHNNIESTKKLVSSVATALAVSKQDLVALYDDDGDDVDRDGRKDSNPTLAATPPKERLFRLGDANASAVGAKDAIGDGILDGRAGTTADATHDGPFWSAVLDTPYTGFIAATGLSTASKWQVNERGQLIDRWQRPLRIRYSVADYGAANFCITSAGPDGLIGTADDIASN